MESSIYLIIYARLGVQAMEAKLLLLPVLKPCTPFAMVMFLSL